jgi:NAD-dependent dihydropyrimidine dehydrogenase PreA subunit
LKWGHLSLTFGRFFLPFHKGAIKRPFYAVLRYIFHACLLIIPIWYSGHIFLWEESRLQWYWTPIPDVWADWMTLLLLSLCAYFLIRRFIWQPIRSNSSGRDFVIISITALPFISGYFLTHGTLESISFFSDHMLILHILSAEIMMIFTAFLFCKTRLKKERCTGCAACEENCPTGTLESKDKEGFRIFTYSHYQCICCGSCVYVCPEKAAELRHEFGVKIFFQILSKEKIREVELAVCEKCGKSFIPSLQLAKIGHILVDSELNGAFLDSCLRCRQIQLGISAMLGDISITRFPQKGEKQNTVNNPKSYGKQ